MKLLVSRSGKFFFVRDLNSDFHTQFGFIRKEDLQKSKEGESVKTNTGKEFFVLKPGFIDLFKRIKRGPQIIPLKDVSAIIAYAGINKESVVVDAGSGSGALACFLGSIARQVFSYEVREDFFRIAEANVEMLELKNVVVKNKDVFLGIDEADVDVVVLDLPEPWKAVEAASGSLKYGGFLVAYCPTTPQVSDFVSAVSSCPAFIYLKTVEMIERCWEVDGRKVRPKSAAIGHSGFLSFARKISDVQHSA